MAKQELLDKIIGDAEARARNILSEAQVKAESLLSAAEDERNALLQSARDMASSARPEVIKRRKSMAELEGRKLVLQAKQEVIAQTYRDALTRIKESKQYPALLVKMILSAADKGDQVIFAASDAKKINPAAIVAEANAQSSLALVLSEEKGAFDGGIVLRGKDCDKNLTLEVELAALRSEEDVCSKVLFG